MKWKRNGPIRISGHPARADPGWLIADLPPEYTSPRKLVPTQWIGQVGEYLAGSVSDRRVDFHVPSHTVSGRSLTRRRLDALRGVLADPPRGYHLRVRVATRILKDVFKRQRGAREPGTGDSTRPVRAGRPEDRD